jgi:hypothetical protein
MWPKGPTEWIDGDTLYVSIPFTWNLRDVWLKLAQRDLWWENAIVGGPAVELMPDYFDTFSEFVTIAHEIPGILQRVNPLATRTTIGCPNKCKFCAVPTIEGGFAELDDWPDNPILCDNNLLKASQKHLDKVFDRLENHTGVDFNQGLDCRLLNDYHAERLARLKQPKVRMSCDSKAMIKPWYGAYRTLIDNGVPKSWIHTYALIAFDSTPGECWTRCEFIEDKCKVYPQWYHSLDCMYHNSVTEEQSALGWSHAARRGIMRYYYKHTGSVMQGIAPTEQTKEKTK